MTCIMRIWSPAQLEGQYLVSFHFDTADGKGFGKFTKSPEKAKRFRDLKEALEFWKRTSKVQPTRPDGEPNRPLTASTVEIVKLPEEPQ